MDELSRVGRSRAQRGSRGWIGVLVVAWALAGGGCFPELPPEVEGDTAIGVEDTVPGDDAAAHDVATEDAVDPVDTGGGDTLLVADVADTGDPGDAATTLSAPAGVSASDDRAGDIEVRWDAVVGASGYHVERCDGDACAASGAWARLTEAAVVATRYVDAAVDAPAAPDAPGGVAASGDRPHDVVVTWSAVVAPTAPRYRYRVIAVDAGGESPPSAVVAGQRAERPVVGYEVRVDGGAWQEVGLDISWTDDAAPAPTVDAGVASASSGTYAEFVRLAVTGPAAAPGAARSYQVRAVTAYGPGASAAAVTGRRAAGALGYLWERSAGTEAIGFAALVGATGPTYDDAGAPSDGSTRWYRVIVRADGAADAVSDAVAGARQGPPNVPGGVTASGDVAAHVVVTWQPVAGALGYHVYRDGVRLTTSGPITTTTYQDAGAPAPSGSWQAPVGLTASTDDASKVTVGWTAPVRPLGAAASYRVRAMNAAGEGPESAEAIGRRAAAALVGYEVEVTPAGGGASWITTGATATGWTHVDPPKAAIGAGTLAATEGDHRGWVRLTVSGATLSQASSVSYRVRGVLAGGGSTPTSAEATGRRASGPLVRQWQRSSGETASGFTNLSGATGASFDDATAPSDGAKRHYRLQLTAAGADPVTLGPVEGWRLAFVQVDGGDHHTCALSRDRTVWCWGSNFRGQLGRGTTGGELAPGRVVELEDVVEVIAGGLMSCARLGSGEVRCWGGDYLGHGQKGLSPTPVVVTGAANATSIGLSGFRGCAVVSGQVRCWGRGDGLNGDNTTEERLSPTPVRTGPSTLLTQGQQVAVGESHNCVQRTNGSVWCWGRNQSGELGVTSVGTSDVRHIATHAASITGATQVAVGSGVTCARQDTGGVVCWGTAHQGRRGDGGTATGGPAPSSVMGGAGSAGLIANGYVGCVLLVEGDVLCWGSNAAGTLGHGGTISSGSFSAAPVVVGLNGAADAVGCGWAHCCAVVDGAVACWGSNTHGQLGADTSPDLSAGDPKPVGLP